MQTSKINLNQNSHSEIELGFDFSNETPEEYKSDNNDSDLQRNDKWLQDRNGNITASVCKNLMSCGQSGGRISWNEKEKIYRLGAGVLKFVYEKAMQRKTGRFIDAALNKKEVKYGTKVEPLILKAARLQLEKNGFTIEEVGYKAFSQVEHAGASSDGILKNKKGEVVSTLEMKACTNWGTHYERVFNPMSDKNMDFWQTTAQTLAWDVDRAHYIVAEPPQDMDKYLYCENIFELEDEWLAECKITIQEVKASNIHQQALLERIRIVNETSDRWLESDCQLDLNVTLHEVIQEFKTAEVTIEAKKLKRNKAKTGVPKMKNPPAPPAKPSQLAAITKGLNFPENRTINNTSSKAKKKKSKKKNDDVPF